VPISCPAGRQRDSDGDCVRKTCGRGQRLNSDGNCERVVNRKPKRRRGGDDVTYPVEPVAPGPQIDIQIGPGFGIPGGGGRMPRGGGGIPRGGGGPPGGGGMKGSRG